MFALLKNKCATTHSFEDQLLEVVTVRGGFVLAAILWEIYLERAGPYLPGVGSALSMQPLSFDRY